MKNNSFNLLNKTWLHLFLIILLGAIAYHNCLPNEMFWDDDDFINNNRFIRDFHYWPLWFSQNLVAGSYLVSNYWRPMLLFLFSIEWQWWHNWVYGWHLVSVGAHILAGIILYHFLNVLFKEPLLALITALIFVVHPVHNEAVVYVNSIGDALATCFVLLSLFFYTRFRQSQKPAYYSLNYFAALMCLPLALLSKETGIVLIGLVCLTDFVFLSLDKSFFKRAIKVLKSTWTFIGLGLIYLILRGTILNFSNSFNFYNDNNEFSTHLSIRLMTFFKAMVQYSGFLFIPYQLRVERQLDWANSFFEWDVLFGGLIVGLMLYTAFRQWQKNPILTFGICWFFIAIAPTSNILVPINAVIYEHFLYIPMIGIVLIVTHLGLTLAQQHKQKNTLFKILGIVLLIFAAINIHRNLDWRTSIGFYEQLITYRPDDYRVINNLGMEYANKGFNDKAITIYLKAIKLDPSNPVAYHNIAGSYRDTGQAQLALDNFKKAIQLNPNFIFSYRSLADLYWKLGKYGPCKECLLQILRIDPNDANTLNALRVIESRLTP